LSTDALKLPDGTDSIRQSLLLTEQCDFERLRAFLLLIPLPTLYWYSRELNIPIRNTIEETDAALSPLLRVIVFLDHAPIASPQLLKSNILYPLLFRVRGLVWPDDAVRLRLDLLTTCPPSAFSVSEFTLDRPRCIENGEYHGELAGQIIFNSGQSSLLDDLVFTVRGAFETSDGHFKEIPVIGHSELRLRVTNEDRHPLMTGNRRLDRHIEELVTKLLKDCPKVREELPDLLEMLQALTRLLATYAQEAIYKGRNDVPESQFQEMVLRDLRFMLGQDVQEHPSQAGGITDIKYRGVIVELKVEKENGDREYISKKYTSQSVQYAGVEARQVSILLVLDLTSKDKPPGDIRNDIILTDVETHGGGDEAKEFPSKWQNDPELAAYLSRLSPNNCSVGDYDASKICWFIIEEDACDIGSVWLEKDTKESEAVILGIFISGEQYRGKGIGNHVIKEAIRISKQRIPFTSVKLNVRKSNLRAIRCYEKCGFIILGEGKKTASDGTIIDYYKMEMKVGVLI